MNIANTKAFKSFLSDLKNDLKEYGFTLDITKYKNVRLRAGANCGGYFSHYEKKIKVSGGIGQTLWIPTLIHESCHFDQWKESNKYYKAADLRSHLMFDNFLAGTSSKRWLNNTKKAIDNIIVMEADCEMRTIEKIKHYNIPGIDIEQEIKMANTYLLGMVAVYKYKKWFSYITTEFVNRNDIPTEFLNRPEDYKINKIMKSDIDLSKFQEILL